MNKAAISILILTVLGIIAFFSITFFWKEKEAFAAKPSIAMTELQCVKLARNDQGECNQFRSKKYSKGQIKEILNTCLNTYNKQLSPHVCQRKKAA